MRGSKYASKKEYYKAGNYRKRNIPFILTEDKFVVRTDVGRSVDVRLEKQRLQVQNQEIIAEETISPDMIDTVGWDWNRWMEQFQPGDVLLKHQLENQLAMDKYDLGTIRDPRQHGKTNYVLKPRILRRLCETPFTGPKSLIYGSHSYGNSIQMTMILKYNLIQNPAVLKNYGMLIDYETYKQSRLQKQTQHIINLIGQRKTSHTFQGITTGQGIRGTSGIDETYIDDPIDLEKEEEYIAATKKFMGWYRFKIVPFCRGGKTWLIGTRYGIKDLWTILDDDRIYYMIERAALLHPIPPIKTHYPEPPETLRASHCELDREWELLAPELWSMQTYAYNGTPAQNIAFEITKLKNRAAQQELMNNPLPLNPLIKWEWIHQYERLTYPDWTYNWALMVDVAAGESEMADYTAFVLVAEKDNKYHIHDILFGKWTGKEKQDKLEEFISKWTMVLDKSVRIKLLIETVMNQRDFYQRIRDESHLTPKAISPSKRRDKLTRITHGLGQEAENGQVYLFKYARNRRQFQMEVDGFPKLKEDHILDAADQAIHYLKGFKRDPRVKAGWL